MIALNKLHYLVAYLEGTGVMGQAINLLIFKNIFTITVFVRHISYYDKPLADNHIIIITWNTNTTILDSESIKEPISFINMCILS